MINTQGEEMELREREERLSIFIRISLAIQSITLFTMVCIILELQGR